MENCKIPKLWCGSSNKLPDGYSKRGTRLSCLRSGVGSGIYQERRNHLPKNSLQQISYIGEKYEKRFKKYSIATVSELIKEMKKLSISGKGQLLRKILKRKDGILDQRAFNSVVLFLYQKGILNLPKCKKINI